MDNKELQRLYKILAGASNYRDLLTVLTALASHVADVRNKLDVEDDSIAVRKATSTILKNTVDSVNRIRDNSTQRPGDGGDDSV